MEESARSGARIVSASPSRWGKDGRGARPHSNCAPMVRPVPRAATCLHSECLCEPRVPSPETFGVCGNGAGFRQQLFSTYYRLPTNIPSTRRTRPSNPTGRKTPHFSVRCQPFRFLGKVGTARHCVARQPAPAACTCSRTCSLHGLLHSHDPGAAPPINWTRPTLPAA
jgi:hypothetical protein